MERICALLDGRRPIYLEGAHICVDVNGRRVEEIAREIRSRVSEG